MKEPINRTKQSLLLDSELVLYLKSQDNHKYSRYDAFVWLVEQILDPDTNDTHASSAYPELLVKYTELAKIWRWSRPTVQKFIEGLESMSVIVKKKHINAFAISLQDMNTMVNNHSLSSTSHPTTDTMLASHDSQSSTTSLLAQSTRKRKSNTGME